MSTLVDHEGRRCVPQIVEPSARVELGAPYRRLEESSVEVVVPQRSAVGRGEDERRRVTWPMVEMCAQLARERFRNRDRSALVRLRRAIHELAMNFAGGLGDLEPTE